VYRVLLVDDKPELLDSLTFALTTLGPFSLETANDGISGLEAACTFHPDCMVIDVQMPGLNGYQLVKALRGDPATANIPLIILTAFPHSPQELIGTSLNQPNHRY
jgi:CheY-like chemotaxis protein